MASAAVKTRYTPEQYLTLERKADFKSEYCNGFITAMAGASREHNLIAVNVSAELRSQLKSRPCEVYMSDMRVLVSQTGLYTYTDSVVVCGEPRFQDDEADTLLNPTMIVEVLSPSTESYDRGAQIRPLPSDRNAQGVCARGSRRGKGRALHTKRRGLAVDRIHSARRFASARIDRL